MCMMQMCVILYVTTTGNVVVVFSWYSDLNMDKMLHNVVDVIFVLMA